MTKYGVLDNKIYAKEITIGDSDYSKITEGGVLRYFNNATVWADMVADLFGKKLNSTAGKLDYNWDENALKFQSGGSITTKADRVSANLEIDHMFKVGTSITFKPHIHWFQDVSSHTVTPFVLTLRYRLQRNGAAKESSWTTVTLTAGTDDLFDFTGESDGTYNQISQFPDITFDCGISDTFQFQMARTDSETGNMLVYFMDLHGEIDSLGSEEEYSKN